MQVISSSANMAALVVRVWLSIAIAHCVANGFALYAQAPVAASVPPALRVGAFEIEPAFAISTGPNSNINQEGGSLQVKSYETVAIPHLDLGWRSGPNQLRGFVAYEFALYSASQTAEGAAAIVPTGRNSFGEMSFSREALISPQISYVHRNLGARADDFEEVAQKSRRVEDNFSAAADLRMGARAHLLAQTGLDRTRYDADAVYEGNDLSEKLNFDRAVVSTGIGYQLTPLTRVDTNFSRFEDRFVDSPERDNGGYILSSIVSFAPRALFTGTAGVGYKSFSPPDPGAESFSGLVMTAKLDYTIRGSTLLMVTLNRDTSYSYDAAKSYYVANQISTSVEQPLVHNLEAFALFNHYKLSYRGVVGGEDRQVGYGGGLRLRLRPWVRVGVNVDHITRGGQSPWEATRVVGFVTYGTRFRKLERTMPGDSYAK